jgi:hypothetical protein
MSTCTHLPDDSTESAIAAADWNYSRDTTTNAWMINVPGTGVIGTLDHEHPWTAEIDGTTSIGNGATLIATVSWCGYISHDEPVAMPR